MSETSVTGAPGEATAPAESAVSADGRLTRAARTRASVVDALLTLNDRGELRPTARDIANEAGVSLRSLYVHFDDLEALFVAASQRHAERLVRELPPLVTEGDLDHRLDAFLARRTRIHEFGAGVRRAALLQEPFSPVLKQALAAGRQSLRNELTSCFAPEIAVASPPDRLVLALEIVSSSAAWESLRIHQRLTVDEATTQVRDMVVAFLEAWVDPSAAIASADVPSADVPSADVPSADVPSDTPRPSAVGPQG